MNANDCIFVLQLYDSVHAKLNCKSKWDYFQFGFGAKFKYFIVLLSGLFANGTLLETDISSPSGNAQQSWQYNGNNDNKKAKIEKQWSSRSTKLNWSNKNFLALILQPQLMLNVK